MKNVLRTLVALTAFTIAVFTDASAQSRWREVQLEWQRTGNPAHPFPSSSGNIISGTLANGGKGGSGVAVSPQDTSQAIFVGDHAERDGANRRANAESLSDTTAVFGILRLRSTVSTIDSIKVARDLSIDGFNWVAVDSASLGGVSYAGTARPAVLAGDSIGVTLSSVTQWDGSTIGAGGLLFYGNIHEQPARRTKYAMAGFNYIRFRVWMNPGDNVAAGTNGGVSASFSFPERQSK